MKRLNNSKSVNGIYTYKQKNANEEKDWKIENLITSPQNYKDERKFLRILTLWK